MDPKKESRWIGLGFSVLIVWIVINHVVQRREAARDPWPMVTIRYEPHRGLPSHTEQRRSPRSAGTARR